MAYKPHMTSESPLQLAAERDRLKALVAEFMAAGDAIMFMQAPSPLESCAYQGPPPKKWMREVAPAIDARYRAVQEAQGIMRAVLARAKEIG